MAGLVHSYDAVQLERYLADHVPGFTTLDGFEKFAGGQSNPTYKVTSGERTFVLRAKPPGDLLASAHQVDREYRVLSALENTDVPVPRTYHLSGEQSPLGAQFFVMEFLDGRIFWDPALPELQREDRRPLFSAMNRTLAALHEVQPEAVGLANYGKPGNYFERQTDRWVRQYRASETDPQPDLEAVIAWLQANMVSDDGQVSLVHGDFRLDNLMFAPGRPEVIGVLDWELSTLGHPLADLAYQCMQWRLPNKGMLRGLAGIDRASQGLPSEREYVAEYCQRRGWSGVTNWNFYLVFSMFRLAAIVQGILHRAANGTASNPGTIDQFGPALRLLGSMARDLTETPSEVHL
ncbi:phosphotransferase [Pseudovibrio exalbescens]|uniref:phosphotransferase n=1 Tax=Pseudovibrio exalbescens TaxID=197461 RepID=UPI0023654981|nr:phosphotransferase [Pseudovibrio exalbescens]MDD7911644.1 phosphotransferase [Pseudovibrio exalbescens]